MALGYPDLDPKAREVIAIDRFIDSLNDADLALKIRERTPTTLDEALKAGLQQEVWNKDTARLRAGEPPQAKAVRPADEDMMKSLHQKMEQLQKQVEQFSRRRTTPVPASDRGSAPVEQAGSPPA